MWQEKWRKLATSQKIFGTIICLCIGIMLFAGTVWLKIQLNPVSFTQKEYNWLRAQTSGMSVAGPGLVKDGKVFGRSWATLLITEEETVVNISSAINTAEGKYLTVITLIDRDLDTWPDNVRIIYIKGSKITGHEYPSVDREMFTHWNVWMIRFLEVQEKAHGMSTLR